MTWRVVGLGLAALAASAYFVSRAIVDTVAWAAVERPAMELAFSSREPPHRELPSTPERASTQAILGRNIFDSSVGPLIGDDAQPAPSATEATAGPPARCDPSYDLVITAIPADPSHAIAAIRHERETTLVGVGDSVGPAEVLRIGWRRAWLRTPKHNACTIALLDPRDRARRTTKRPAKAATSRAEWRNAIAKGVRALGADRAEIDANLVDRLLDEPAKLMRTARALPHEQNGRVVGLRLSRVRPGGVLGRLGLRNGDIVRRIDGYDTTDPAALAEVLEHLRRARSVSVELTRAGNAKTLLLSIR